MHLVKWLERLIELVSISVLGLLCLTVLIQISSRLFNSPFMWTEELARHFLVALTFIGAAFAYYKGVGLRLTFLVEKLPKKIQQVNNIVMDLFALFAILFVMYFSVQLATALWASPTPSMRISKGLIILTVPLGFLLIVIRLLGNFRLHFQQHSQ